MDALRRSLTSKQRPRPPSKRQLVMLAVFGVLFANCKGGSVCQHR